MSVKQIRADEAHRTMNESADVVYIDVRTPAEFERGHPPRAINVPVVLPHPATRRMDPNPDFLRVVEKHVEKERTVIVGCQMGGRSQLAAELMAEAGYTDVSNLEGGFGGARDPMGGLGVPGWIQHELPVETDVPSGAGYQDLSRGLG